MFTLNNNNNFHIILLYMGFIIYNIMYGIIREYFLLENAL